MIDYGDSEEIEKVAEDIHRYIHELCISLVKGLHNYEDFNSSVLGVYDAINHILESEGYKNGEPLIHFISVSDFDLINGCLKIDGKYDGKPPIYYYLHGEKGIQQKVGMGMMLDDIKKIFFAYIAANDNESDMTPIIKSSLLLGVVKGYIPYPRDVSYNKELYNFIA